MCDTFTRHSDGTTGGKFEARPEPLIHHSTALISQKRTVLINARVSFGQLRIPMPHATNSNAAVVVWHSFIKALQTEDDPL